MRVERIREERIEEVGGGMESEGEQMKGRIENIQHCHGLL